MTFFTGKLIDCTALDEQGIEAGRGLCLRDIDPAIDQERLKDHIHSRAFRQDPQIIKKKLQDEIQEALDRHCDSIVMTISWSILFPRGDEEYPNEEGIAIYQELFETLSKHDIEPIVILCQSLMPLDLALSNQGWSSRQTIDTYLNFAYTCFSRFKDLVHYWICQADPCSITSDPFVNAGILNAQTKQCRKACHYRRLAMVYTKLLLEKVDSAAKLGLQIDRYDPSSAYLVHDDRGPAYPLENFVEPFDIDLLKEEAIDFVFLNDASCSIDLDTLYRVYQKPLLLVGKPKENVRHFVIGIVSKKVQ